MTKKRRDRQQRSAPVRQGRLTLDQRRRDAEGVDETEGQERQRGAGFGAARVVVESDSGHEEGLSVSEFLAAALAAVQCKLL